MKFFIGRGAFIAVMDGDDENHKAAAALYRDSREKRIRFVTTNFIVCETRITSGQRFQPLTPVMLCPRFSLGMQYFKPKPSIWLRNPSLILGKKFPPQFFLKV